MVTGPCCSAAGSAAGPADGPAAGEGDPFDAILLLFNKIQNCIKWKNDRILSIFIKILSIYLSWYPH
jgi:hypothetical protein